jgi:transposase
VAPLFLNALDRIELQEILRSKSVGKALCRAQALLWIEDGESVYEVAEILNVSRQTIYNWIKRFQERSCFKIYKRILDAPRSGRPSTALGVIDPIIDEIIESDPRTLGYYATNWTGSLLQNYLNKFHDIDVSRKSISLAIARLGIHWKRPRYVLALKSAVWRQQKGGSKEA